MILQVLELVVVVLVAEMVMVEWEEAEDQSLYQHRKTIAKLFACSCGFFLFTPFILSDLCDLQPFIETYLSG